MTPVGINNGNFRNGDYREWAAQDLSGVPTWDQLMEMKKVKETYGENWEQDADALRACVDSVNLYPVEAAYALEQTMEAEYPKRINGLVIRTTADEAAIQWIGSYIDVTALGENTSKRSAALKSKIDARLAAAKERNARQYGS